MRCSWGSRPPISRVYPRSDDERPPRQVREARCNVFATGYFTNKNITKNKNNKSQKPNKRKTKQQQKTDTNQTKNKHKHKRNIL